MSNISQLLKGVTDWVKTRLTPECLVLAEKMNRIERENDLVTYISCCDRLEHLHKVMEAYPKDMTLEEVEKSLRFQADRFHDLVMGPPPTR